MGTRIMLMPVLLGAYAWAQLSPGSWRTDVSKHSVEITELVGAGKKGGIKSVDHPKFVSTAEASKWLHPKEPVIVVSLNGEARAYPLQILIWHLLVNDQIGDTPILVSYSVFCHSSIVFDRRVRNTTSDFGFSGMVRNSDFVMFDRQSESLWQQLTGDAIVGELTGDKLRILDSQIAPFDVFAASFRDGKVLSRDTGVERNYGQNPYARSLADGRLRFPVKLANPLPVPAMDELVAIRADGSIQAYPVSLLSDHRVIENRAGARTFIILSDNSMLNATDAPVIAESGKGTATGVFSPILDGKTLSFRSRAGAITDKQTGSVWNVLGVSTKGPLMGKHLTPLPHTRAFAFGWLVFHPETIVITGPGPVVPDLAGPVDETNPDPRRTPAPSPGSIRPPQF